MIIIDLDFEQNTVFILGYKTPNYGGMSALILGVFFF
jgi:hypothetical protein